MAQTSNERFARDSHRRLVQMFGNVVRDIPGERFEEAIAEAKSERGVELDTELEPAMTSWRLPRASRASTATRSVRTFPEDPRDQLEAAIRRCSSPGTASARPSTAG